MVRTERYDFPRRVNAPGPRFPLDPFPLLPNTGSQRASSLSGHSRSTVSILGTRLPWEGSGHKATCTTNLRRSACPEVATYHSRLGKAKTPGWLKVITHVLCEHDHQTLANSVAGHAPEASADVLNIKAICIFPSPPSEKEQKQKWKQKPTQHTQTRCSVNPVLVLIGSGWPPYCRSST